MDLTPQQWLKRLEMAHSAELPDLKKLNAHFQGTQPLNYLNPELLAELDNRLQQVVINWPELVVDCLDERLDIEGFRVAGQAKDDTGMQEIWQYNDLDEASQQAHVEAFVMRRSFAIIGANEAEEIPLITIESPLEVQAYFNPRTRQVDAACKWWDEKDVDEKDIHHATLYLPMETIWLIKDGADWVEDPEYPRDEHGLEVVPVVPLVNRPRLRVPGGKSELDSIIPISDAANKIATDMMVSAEFHAMPRRWALGFGPEDFVDENGNKLSSWSQRAGKVWASEKTRQQGAEVGQFPETQLSNFHSTLDLLARVVGALGALPPSFMGFETANPASADAIRASETRLVKRAERRHRGFGGGWEQTMRIADRVRTGDWRPDLRRLETRWRDASTPTIAQSADAAVKLFQGGIVPLRQTREDLNYSDEQIRLMEEEDARKKAEDAAAAAALAPAPDEPAPDKPDMPMPEKASVPA